jgi:hypothetical protein
VLMHCEAPRSTKSIQKLTWLFDVLFDADTAFDDSSADPVQGCKAKFQLVIIDAISSGHPWYLAGRIWQTFSPSS